MSSRDAHSTLNIYLLSILICYLSVLLDITNIEQEQQFINICSNLRKGPFVD